LLPLIAVARGLSMTRAEQFWWLAPVMSVLALMAVVWFQWGEHKVRAFRSRRPFHAVMSIPPSADETRELRVAAHSRVVILVRMRPVLHYRELEVAFGFHGDDAKRPMIIKFQNPFIKEGARREQSPATTPTHYIDHDDYYHIKEPSERTKPNTYTIGFVVQTRDAGRYPVYLEIITDCGDGKPREELTLIVEEPAPNG
jgi:hypothetical protein